MMDYEFSIDYSGEPLAEFSMGHELFGQWLSDEVGSSVKRCQALINSIEQLERDKQGEAVIPGKRLTLTLNHEDAFIVGEVFEESDQDFLEENSLEEMEMEAACGLKDFKDAVADWKSFITK